MLTSMFTDLLGESLVFFDPPIQPDLLPTFVALYTSWFTITWITYTLILWDIYKLQCVTFRTYSYEWCMRIA